MNTATTKTKTTESSNPVLKSENLDKLFEEHKTKSAVMRHLAAKGYSRGDIARAMGVKYQFVRNVLVSAAEKAAKTSKSK